MALQRLLTSLALLALVVLATDWRGLSPSLQQKLSAVSSFTCDQGRQRLDLTRLNDNYCDCQDGSDEPGTSACSHTRAVFHCANAGFFAAELPTSRVNDGVCDCCDGSDEYASGATCASDCEQHMQQFRADKKDLIEQVEAGLKDRVALANEAQQLWEEQQHKRKQIETSTLSLKVMAEQLEARKSEEERLEQQEKENRVATSKHEILTQLGLLELSKEQLLSIVLEVGRTAKHELLPLIRKEREAARDGDEELPKTPMDEQDDAFRERDDARQKETRRIEKLIEKRRKEEEKKAQEAKEALEQAAEAAESGEAMPEAESEAPASPAEEVAAPEEEEEDLTLPEVEARPIDLLYEALEASERHERGQAAETRKQYEDTQKELKEEEKKLKDVQDLMDQNYGPDHIFFALRDKCVESDPSKYLYKICFFGKATQDSTKLGDMEAFKTPEQAEGNGSGEDTSSIPTDMSAEGETVVEELKFSKGQKCWNGPNRSLTVKLECGPMPMTLFDVEEPSTCLYNAKLRTPAVCSEADRDRIMTLDDGSARVSPHHIEVEVLPTL